MSKDQPAATGAAHPPNAEGPSEEEVHKLAIALRQDAYICGHMNLVVAAENSRIAADLIERLQAQLAEAQKDAERYKWLRKHRGIYSQDHDDRGRSRIEISIWYPMAHPMYEERLDALIDAARAQEKL